jgi:hypothetical protein
MSETLSKARIRKLSWRALINGILPVVVYWLLRPQVGSDTIALGLAAGIPICWGVVQMIRSRRVEKLGVVVLAGFLLAFRGSLAAKDNPLPLKLYGSVIAALLGIAFLVSIALRRPLVLTLLRILARYEPRFLALFEKVSREPANLRRLNVVTAIIGTTLLIDAVAHATVAILLPTGSYLIVVRLVNWVIRGSGAIALICYIRKWRAQRPDPSLVRVGTACVLSADYDPCSRRVPAPKAFGVGSGSFSHRPVDSLKEKR